VGAGSIWAAAVAVAVAGARGGAGVVAAESAGGVVGLGRIVAYDGYADDSAEDDCGDEGFHGSSSRPDTETGSRLRGSLWDANIAPDEVVSNLTKSVGRSG
jgi:hypothetical protein